MTYGNTIWGLVFGLGAMLPCFAQTKPAESTSKVKKIFHYTKVGGWVHVDGIKDLTAVLNLMAPAKGFAVTHSANEGMLTLDNLKQFDAIVWDNNVNGGGSVPSGAQRTAVLDYVKQGGGWLLVHGAGDHGNSWGDLQQVLGTTFSTHGSQGYAEISIDNEAVNHKELKYMVQDLPKQTKITKDEWYAFQKSVRGAPGMTIVATVNNGQAGVLLPYSDGSQPKDATYIWHKMLEKGRVLYTAVGHGGNQLYAQADSFATKSFWQNLRFVAGDFENGCTDPKATNYSAEARVNDNSCTGVVSTVAPAARRSGVKVSFSSFNHKEVSMDFPVEGDYSIQIRDAKGSVVWNRKSIGAANLNITSVTKPGVYYVIARSGNTVVKHRVPLI